MTIETGSYLELFSQWFFFVCFVCFLFSIITGYRFVVGHKLHGDLFPFSIILIEQFCSCYIEPHLSFTCPPSWTTSRAKFLTYLRPIGLETLPAYYTENFVFSAL